MPFGACQDGGIGREYAPRVLCAHHETQGGSLVAVDPSLSERHELPDIYVPVWGVHSARGPRPMGMLAYMQRTTVKLPDELDARLRHEAQRRGTTVSELTREAIEAHLGGPRPRRKLLAAATGASGHDDISERIEEILANEVGSLL